MKKTTMGCGGNVKKYFWLKPEENRENGCKTHGSTAIASDENLLKHCAGAR